MAECAACGSQVHRDEHDVLIDNSGGDVCGVEGGNEPHVETYDWLDDPTERAFLVEVDPAEVAANAHRAYEWLTERGVAPDSVLREAAFTKAAGALRVDYDDLYAAWLDRVPLVLP